LGKKGRKRSVPALGQRGRKKGGKGKTRLIDQSTKTLEKREKKHSIRKERRGEMVLTRACEGQRKKGSTGMMTLSLSEEGK